MAHFARVNELNIVEEVLVVSNDLENRGAEFLSIDLGLGGNWLQTSYNGNIRKQFAGIGYSYNETLDMFIIPKCHDEAMLNEMGDWDCDNIEHEVTTNG